MHGYLSSLQQLRGVPTPRSVQCLLLAIHLGINPGGLEEPTIQDAKDSTQASCLQAKCPTRYTTTPALQYYF